MLYPERRNHLVSVVDALPPMALSAWVTVPSSSVLAECPAVAKDRKLMITERRQHPRKTPTEFTFIQLEQEFGGRVLNYSTNGLCFETSTPICQTDLVQFWLSFPRHGQVDGVGKITWLSEKRNLGGITFVHLSRASRQKIDELTSPVSEHAAESVAGETEDRESPEAIVSHIMEQVLAERRKSSVAARPLVTHADHSTAPAAEAQAQQVEPAEPSKAGSSEVFTPAEVDVTDSASVAMPPEPPPQETSISGTARPFAPPAQQCEDGTDSDGAATVERRESSTERTNASLPPVFTPITPESFDLWSMAGSGEPRPAHSSPAPSSHDATALESVLQRESSKDAATVAENGLRDDKPRKWPVPSALVTTTFAEPTDLSTIQDSSSEDMKGWVPLKQYFYSRWAQFLRGAAVGTGISLLIAVVILTFWKPAERATLTGGTANAVSANSSIAEGATAPEPAFPLTMESQSPEPSPRNMIAPGKTHVAGAESSATAVPSRTSGVASVPNPAPNSSQNSPENSTNAIPTRSSFAHRNAEPGSASQPLFELSQPANPDGPTAETDPGNGQSNLRVDLGSTPWTFRRKNIHGNTPVGGDLRPAELVRYVAPLYPEPARTRHISGEVVIDAMIDTQGNVRKPQVVSGPSLLRSAALNAVSSWKYKPALLDGKPTEVHETITLKFDAQ